jgi:HEAT repeat protein
MHRMILGALVIASAVGCSRKGPPPAAQGGAAPPQLVPAPVGPEWEAPQPGGAVYLGRSAPQWGEQLQAQDPLRRAEAAMALGKLGPAGYPYLIQRIKQGSDDVRLVTLQAMAKQELTTNQRETMPLLFDMLASRNPALRQAGACRLAWYGLESQRALQPLQRLADTDSDPEVRRVAAQAITDIQECIQTGGKITRGQPGKPMKN